MIKDWLRGVDLFSSPALISTQVVDSVLRKSDIIGKNGDSFLHFSYTFMFLATSMPLPPFLPMVSRAQVQSLKTFR